MPRIFLFLISFVISLNTFPQSKLLDQNFKNPPLSYRPGCYYYWINNNISIEGVTKDIAAMAEAGIGRAFIGNVGFPEEEMFLKYGTAKLFSREWWNVTNAAMNAGVKNGVDIGLFNSPGWSQSGGPWIKHTQAMRYLSSQEIVVEGARTINYRFETDSLFQQVSVLAFPQPAYENDFRNENISRITTDPDTVNLTSAFDNDLNTFTALPNGIRNLQVSVEKKQPFTARTLIIYPSDRPFIADIMVQVRDGSEFRTVRSFHYDRSNYSKSVGFKPKAPVLITFPQLTSKVFRLVLTNIRGTGGFAEIVFSNAARIERYEEKQLAKMFQTPLPLWNEYQWGREDEVKDKNAMISQSRMIDLTKLVTHDGTLKWDAPKGKWIVVRYGMMPTGVTNAPATPEGTGYDVDKINKKAVQDHFQHFIQRIQNEIPETDRKAFKYVVADSYETGSQNWTDQMVISFKKTFGYDPVKWLPVLTGRVVESKDKSNRFLWDLRRLVANKVAYDYVGGLREISNKNGLGLWLENYGHWGYPSEFLMYGGQSNEVGGEFWAEGDLGSIECRAASSAAHIYGKNSVSAESFTAAGNPYARYPAVLKRRGDWSFTEGINNTIFHVYIQQPTETKPGVNAWFGTEFNRHNTWFKQGKAFIDYIRRCNYMLQQGKPVNDVAYFIGEDAPKMTGVTDPALPPGYQFDYINAEVIETRLSVKDGRLVLPDGVSYQMLVLPKLETMRPELLQKIVQLVKEGAIILGPRPFRSPSMQGYPAADIKVKNLSGQLWKGLDGKINRVANFGKGKVMSGLTMEEAFREINLKPDFEKNTDENILFVHRSDRDKEIYFISNQKEAQVDFQPLFRAGEGQPYLYDPVSGSKRILKNFSVESHGIRIPLSLDTYQSCFIIFNKNETGRSSSQHNFPEPVTSVPVVGPWKLSFDQSMRGPSGDIVFTKLVDWSQHENEAIHNYSGTAIYKTKFNLDRIEPGQTVYINLGTVKVMATVKINGKTIGTAWTAPWKLDATHALRQGVNDLEIEVVNTWVNRLIGDSKLLEAERRTWSNVNTIKPDTPYDSSGLMGPVRLEFVRY